MARPRASKHPVTINQLSSLSSEVLRLRLRALNLPVRDSRQQLITRLKSALESQANRAGRAMPVHPWRSSRRKEHTNAASATAQPTDLNSERDSNSDDNSLSIEDGSPSLDDLLSLEDHSALPPAVGSAPSPADTHFTDGQLRISQQTVQAAMKNARIQQEHANEPQYSSPPVRNTGMASPLSLQRTLDPLFGGENPAGWVRWFCIAFTRLVNSPPGPNPSVSLRGFAPRLRGHPHWLFPQVGWCLHYLYVGRGQCLPWESCWTDKISPDHQLRRSQI